MTDESDIGLLLNYNCSINVLSIFSSGRDSAGSEEFNQRAKCKIVIQLRLTLVQLCPQEMSKKKLIGDNLPNT